MMLVFCIVLQSRITLQSTAMLPRPWQFFNKKSVVKMFLLFVITIITCKLVLEFT